MSKTDFSRSPSNQECRMPRASAGRLSHYLRLLESLHREGQPTVSSGFLAESLGYSDAQVRKDLAYLGNLGQPGIGYPIENVIAAIRTMLGIDRSWTVALVGVGNLARALLRYKGFHRQGFQIVALFDTDSEKIGQVVEGVAIAGTEQIHDVVRSSGVELGILTVPSEAAQGIADALADAGIRGIMNFTPGVLRLPPSVSVVSVDLSMQLEQLAFLVQLKHHQEP